MQKNVLTKQNNWK